MSAQQTLCVIEFYDIGVYAASKAGLEAGSDALRVELAHTKVSFTILAKAACLRFKAPSLYFSGPCCPSWPGLHPWAHSPCKQVFLKIFIFHVPYQIFRQGDHYEAMSGKVGDKRDLEEFKMFSHIFSNCLPKPGLKMIQLESIYRFY